MKENAQTTTYRLLICSNCNKEIGNIDTSYLKQGVKIEGGLLCPACFDRDFKQTGRFFNDNGELMYTQTGAIRTK